MSNHKPYGASCVQEDNLYHCESIKDGAASGVTLCGKAVIARVKTLIMSNCPDCIAQYGEYIETLKASFDDTQDT